MRTPLAAMLDEPGPVALVVQGGGMRGAYSIAALAELSSAGYRSRFTDVYGTSAGAINAAYFLAGQALGGIDVYVEHLTGKAFINLARPRKVVDIDFLIDEVLTHRYPLDRRALYRSPSRLHIGMTATHDARLVWTHGDADVPLLEALRASAALPVAYGQEVLVGHERYVDGGLVTTVPIMQAIADGHTRICLVLTRPVALARVGDPWWTVALLRGAGRLRRHSPAVRQALGRPDQHFERARQLALAPPTGINIQVIAPSAGTCSLMTRTRSALTATAALGRVDARLALGRSGL